MKYLLLAYGDEKQVEAMSPGERDAFTKACLANDEALRKNGHLLAVQGLQSSRTATTVRLQNGKVSLTDGPVTKSEEQLIGLFFIDARDLNEAIQVAAQMPRAQRGPIEVRPTLSWTGGCFHFEGELLQG